MGGSSRRQRSTSETRRRADRRRQCSTTQTDRYEDDTTTSIHGLSSIFIWILATSSLIVVYTPTSPATNNPLSTTSYDPIPSAEKLILDDISPSFKMHGHHYQQHYEHSDQQPPMMMSKYDFPQFNRPKGIRWRDDDRMMREMFAQQQQQQQQHSYPVMPVLTEHQPSHSFGMPSTSSHQGTSSYGDYGSPPSPSLADLDLIDCLWRSDADGGMNLVSPAEQYECDLQTLTQKSTMGQLSEEESLRYEDLSKGFYTGFYENIGYSKYAAGQVKSPTPEQQTPQNNQEEEQITEADLEELLKDVDHEESELNKVFESKTPVLNNVSLSDGTVYTQANLTEMQEMQESCNQINLTASGVVSSSQSATLFNDTDAVTDEMWQPTNTVLEDVFPQSSYVPLHQLNATGEVITSNGNIGYDHGYTNLAQSPFVQPDSSSSSSSTGRQQQTQTSPNSASVTSTATHSIFDTYHDQRNSMSDYTTDSSSPCSRGSQSPAYDAHDFRMDGKLMPHRENQDYGRSSPSRSTRINRVMSNGQRKRGRQSKDEQLAQDHALPVTALEISEMSLSELQNVLKMDDLSEYQRQLIRKIRRRGKNKVAARTCRQRRTDRHDKVNMNHYI